MVEYMVDIHHKDSSIDESAPETLPMRPAPLLCYINRAMLALHRPHPPERTPMSEKSLDQIAREFWEYSSMMTSVSSRGMPALLAAAAEQIYTRYRETHPETTREDVMAALSRQRPS